MPLTQRARRQRIRHRIRKQIAGTAQRPRLSLYKSHRTLYLQLIDDTAGHTLVAADSRAFQGKNQEAAAKTGALLAEKAKAKKITHVVFDRSGYPYHGVVKALSLAARQGGLQH